MDLVALLDPVSAAIVLGGTVLATALGSGRRELAASFSAMAQLFHHPFDYEKSRAEIARDVAAIRTDGVLRAQSLHSTDREIASVGEAMIHDRSLTALISTHERFRDDRCATRALALRPVLLAAEMGPVFGMVGTLVSLSQMQGAAHAASQGNMINGIAMAVLTTLYGLILAHPVCNPIARLIARRGEREEELRQQLIDWLAQQLAQACPPRLRTTAARPEQAA
jgi:chemotaxis protein MotA